MTVGAVSRVEELEEAVRAMSTREMEEGSLAADHYDCAGCRTPLSCPETYREEVVELRPRLTDHYDRVLDPPTPPLDPNVYSEGSAHAEAVCPDPDELPACRSLSEVTETAMLLVPRQVPSDHYDLELALEELKLRARRPHQNYVSLSFL